MGWVFLEIVVALALAVGIVWWTMPRKPSEAEERANKGMAEERANKEMAEERANKEMAAEEIREKDQPPPG